MTPADLRAARQRLGLLWIPTREMDMTKHIDRLVANLDELHTAICDAIAAAVRHSSEIYVETADGPTSNEEGTRFRLVERTLTDGSTVFNVVIGG